MGQSDDPFVRMGLTAVGGQARRARACGHRSRAAARGPGPTPWRQRSWRTRRTGCHTVRVESVAAGPDLRVVGWRVGGRLRGRIGVCRVDRAGGCGMMGLSVAERRPFPPDSAVRKEEDAMQRASFWTRVGHWIRPSGAGSPCASGDGPPRRICRSRRKRKPPAARHRCWFAVVPGRMRWPGWRRVLRRS